MEHVAKLIFKVRRPADFHHQSLCLWAGSRPPCASCSQGKKENHLPKTPKVHIDLREVGQVLKEAAAWIACPPCTLSPRPGSFGGD